MKITAGLQCHFRMVFLCQLMLCLCLPHSGSVVSAKSVEQHHPTKDLEYGGSGASDGNSCDSVTHYFNSLNITIRSDGQAGKFIFVFI